MQRNMLGNVKLFCFEFGVAYGGQVDIKLGTVNLKAAQIEAAAVGLITT